MIIFTVKQMRTCVVSIFLLFLAVVSQHAFAQVKVNINLISPEHHLANVDIIFPATAEDNLTLYLPTWRTGRYQILNLANGIRNFVVTADNTELNWRKTAKDSWEIAGVKNQVIKVSYQVYANQLSYRTRHIDDSHAFLDNSTVIMYSKHSRAKEHIISLQVPNKWRSVSGLAYGSHAHQFIAPNYDVLADSPIETGINEFHHFTVAGRNYELVIWGQGNYDSKKMLNDLKIMVKQSKHIWQDYPFSRYVFMVHATSGARGATEHINSTIIQRSRFQFSQRKDYLGFLLTAAHEFVHTWNVKQYRPKGLVPYDYQQENYSNLLWLAEGSTSYLQSQLLTRGDLITSKEFLDKLAKRVAGYLRKPGRDSQTIAQASFDAWINESGDYGNNHSVNIYSEGYLVSWLLDFDILTRSKLKKSYRDVHNLLYKHHRIPKSYDEADVLAILKQITGEDYNAWWQKNIHGFAKPDFNQLLSKAGLTIKYSNSASGKKVNSQVFTGIKTKKHSHGLMVTHVEKNSPAWRAGLTTDDIIIAIDDLRLVGDTMANRLKDFSPEQSVKLSFFRRDQLMSQNMTLAEVPKGKLMIVPVTKASKKQKAFFNAWTGLPFPKSRG